MAGNYDVIELFSSSDETSLSNIKRRRCNYSSSEEEEKKQHKATTRRSLHIERQRKRVGASESERDSDEREEERKPARGSSDSFGATSAYVAPTNRARSSSKMDDDRREITEAMNLYELQAQEQMMARYRAQNRRKNLGKTRAEAHSDPPIRNDSHIVTSGSNTARRGTDDYELETKRKRMKAISTQKRPQLMTKRRYQTESESEESGESEESEEKQWKTFTKKSAERESLRKQKQQVKRIETLMEKSVRQKERTNKVFVSRKNKDPFKLVKQPVVRKNKVSEEPKTRKRKRKETRTTSSNSSSEAEVQESEQEKEEPSDEDSVERSSSPTPLRRSYQKRDANQSVKTNKKRQQGPLSFSPTPSHSNTSKCFSKPQPHSGLNETHHLAEKMSFRELQEQEKLLSFFQAQKKSITSSTGRKGKSNGPKSTAPVKINGTNRRASMGINTSATSSSFSYVSPPSRTGFTTSSADSVTTAECTARPVEKSWPPVIHSTAWRRLVFEQAPPNILRGVDATPYATGFNKPLWTYDVTGELEEKCRFVPENVGTEQDAEKQSQNQSQVNRLVRTLLENEFPRLQQCHARRVRHLVTSTRKQVKEYLNAHQILHSDRYRRLQWSELANHKSRYNLSPIDRVVAKRINHSSMPSFEPYNSLVGKVGYLIHYAHNELDIAIYPETVIQLSKTITALRRSFTMIGIRKNVFVESDSILRYVPYLGDGAQVIVENDLYTETTMRKERQVAVIGDGKALQVSKPSARENEMKEYLLRLIVRTLGATDDVFRALEEVAGFHDPRADYVRIKDLVQMEERTARRTKKVKAVIASGQKILDTAAGRAAKALRHLAAPCWFLQATKHKSDHHQSLHVRLQPPLSVFESSYADAPEALGLRDRTSYEGLVEWHRDLFCRRCYSYDCVEHGIQNPPRTLRVDPVYPMVTIPELMLQPVSKEERELLTLTGPTPSSASVDNVEIVELSSSSSSSSENEGEQPASQQQTTLYRRSRRTQTRISSLASKSLHTQEKILEAERLAELEKRKKRRETFARAADHSEYLDNSYLPVVTALLQPMLSKTQSCGRFCWMIAAQETKRNAETALRPLDAVLVRKLASTVGSNACVIAALLQSPTCTCSQIYDVLPAMQRQNECGKQDVERRTVTFLSVENQRKNRRMGTGSGNKSLAKRIRAQRSSDRDKKMSYVPCNHDNACDETCECSKRGHSCHRTCSCPRECPNRFQGCKCSMGNCHTTACPCWNAGRECDPDYCFNCGASDAAIMAFHSEFKSKRSSELKICQNVNMVRGSLSKKLGVAFSKTHGWGAYALEPIRKDEFVLEYTGELILDDEAERRGAIYDRKAVSYLFGVNSEYVVDAARKGNKAKFANHRAKAKANLDVRVITSNGEHRIGLFAREPIEVGAEVFFDYGYTHDRAPKWSQHGMAQINKCAYNFVEEDDEWE